VHVCAVHEIAYCITLSPVPVIVANRLKLFVSTHCGVFNAGGSFCAGRPDGLYAYPDSCSCFYQCANGGTFIMRCAPGNVYFDPDHTPAECHWEIQLTCDRRRQCGLSTAGLVYIRSIHEKHVTHRSPTAVIVTRVQGAGLQTPRDATRLRSTELNYQSTCNSTQLTCARQTKIVLIE